MQVRDYLAQALIEIGVISDISDMVPEDASRALAQLRRMRDAFMAQRLTLYTVDRQSFNLTPHVQTYTVGPSGTILTANRARPLFISNVGVLISADVERPVYPLTRAEWLRLTLRSLEDLYPRRYNYEPTDTNGTLNVWPIPTSAATLKWGTPLPLQAIPAAEEDALATQLAFPEGYEDAWVKNLAVRCLRPFRKADDPQLRDDARAALAVIEKLNDEGPPPSRTDPAPEGGYDIWSNQRV